MKVAFTGLLLLVSLTTALAGCGLPGEKSEKPERTEEREADARLSEEKDEDEKAKESHSNNDNEDDKSEKAKENRSEPQEKDNDKD